jgi:hypothetical protein
MRQQLAGSYEVQLLKGAVEDFGLTYEVADQRRVNLPAYDGSLEMQYAGRASTG